MFDTFYCLHYLEPPASYAKDSQTKKNMWKFTIKDSQELTMQHFLTVNEFQIEFREKIIQKNKQFNIRTQVLMAAIGPNLEESLFYVFYDNIVYKFQSILEAYDCAFKIHIVFNLKYQAQCQHFWEFIQCYFYGIPLTSPGIRQKSIMKHADALKSTLINSN